MPESRLQRTRKAYEEPRKPTEAEQLAYNDALSAYDDAFALAMQAYKRNYTDALRVISTYTHV